MDMKWLEPSISIRIEEIVDECGEQEEFQERLLLLISEIKSKMPECYVQITSELENLFYLKTRQDVSRSYRNGLSDGLGFSI